MSMRSQVYQYTQTAANTMTAPTSIFVGGLGNNITKPAETTATQFVVIEQVASTPDISQAVANAIGSFTQVRINTTDYFLITVLTMVYQEVQVLTQEVYKTNRPLTYTQMYMFYQGKFGMFFRFKEVLTEQQLY